MSDHFSGPAVMGDPAVDLTDFFAFPSPERPGNLVLIMDVFPLATPQSVFSDVVTHRFRLRPLARATGGVVPGGAEFSIDVCFDDVPDGASVQEGRVVTSDGRAVSLVVGTPTEQDGMRVFAGLASDPFFMDVEAALRTDISGELAFDTANTVQSRDVLSIVVDLPFAPIVERLGGATLVAAVCENLFTRPGKPIRLERLGRPEIKNLSWPTRPAIRTRRESSFAISTTRRTRSPLPGLPGTYESRLDANLAFFDGLDGKLCGRGPDRRHPLRDLLIDDFLILDLENGFAPGSSSTSSRRCSPVDRTGVPAVAGSTTTSSTSCSRCSSTAAGASGWVTGFPAPPSRPGRHSLTSVSRTSGPIWRYRRFWEGELPAGPHRGADVSR